MIVIARLTVRELVRRRVVWVLAALSVLSVLLVALGLDRLVSLARDDGASELEIRLASSQLQILIAFMFSFVLAMTAAFLGAPAIGGDIDSGIALAVLARPIRRIDLLLGRWLGLAAVTAAYAVVSGALAMAAVAAVSGYTPPAPLLAIAFLAAASIVLLTLTLALGTALPSMAAGAISVVLYGLGWMAGVLGAIGPLFGAPSLTTLADVTRVILPTDGLWRGTVFGLEPPAAALLAGGRSADALAANPFYALDPPPAAFVAWAVIWTVIVLGLAGWWLDRREI
jgi:ABC-type transport system involved in multi-copper enzyme maturation permease subunit